MENERQEVQREHDRKRLAERIAGHCLLMSGPLKVGAIEKMIFTEYEKELLTELTEKHFNIRLW